jgi:hypothetical protein
MARKKDAIPRASSRSIQPTNKCFGLLWKLLKEAGTSLPSTLTITFLN